MPANSPEQSNGFFKRLKDATSKRIPGTEANAVNDFLERSANLASMGQIAIKNRRIDIKSKDDNPNQMETIVNQVKCAKTFGQILDVLERFVPKEPRRSTSNQLKKTGKKAILFIGGYVNQEANFAYYATCLYNKANAKRLELGYNHIKKRLG